MDPRYYVPMRARSEGQAGYGYGTPDQGGQQQIPGLPNPPSWEDQQAALQAQAMEGRRQMLLAAQNDPTRRAVPSWEQQQAALQAQAAERRRQALLAAANDSISSSAYSSDVRPRRLGEGY